jgi:NAD(P)-dependent dehydrogenase (short-subunit alcohol dehydrogenase family)
MIGIAQGPARVIGAITFTEQDQRDFALASLDSNPMHMDAVAARRLISGRQVVHGVHTLIHALELCTPTAGNGAVHVDCQFTHPINVGDRVEFSQTDEPEGHVRIRAAVDGMTCTDVVLTRVSPAPAAALAEDGRAVRQIAALAAPLDEDAGSQAGQRFVLEAAPGALADHFPRAAALLGGDALRAVAQLSRFVGMVCPGLHSVFSSLQFSVIAGATAPSVFEVQKYDPRFRLYSVGFDGPLRGQLRAFQRPPPQQQPSAGTVAAQVGGQEFAGQRALVVGSSRGLGETVAKIIGAGGGDVVITYASGLQDARAVADDIHALGRGRCDCVALDLRTPLDGVQGVDPGSLDMVFFFATPRIYAPRAGLFSRRAFDEFAEFYLQRFYELCNWLERGERSRPVRVYLPSTVFIDERPKGMTEYAMAKAAAEVLADDLNRSLRNVNVVHSRLPRLATDQTASILKVTTESNIEHLLAVVRRTAGS